MDNKLLLEALQEAGVDNWEGYSFAMDLYKEKAKKAALENEFSDIISDILSDVSVSSTPDPSLPELSYDGNIKGLYEIVKNFVFKIEEL